MNNDEKTLVILTPGFAKDEADTTCIPMQQSFVRFLQKKHPQLHIIILAFQYPYEKKIYRWHGNVVICFGGRNRGGLQKLLLRKKWNKMLENMHQEKKITGVLSFWYGECALAGKKFSNKHNVKHYCWMWGQDARKGNKYTRRARLDGNELIAFSDFLRDEFEKNYHIRPRHVAPPGIDVKEFSSVIPTKDIDLIAAGSLIPLKQYTVFVEIVAEIKKVTPSIKAVMIGDGPEKNELQALIERKGLLSNVILTGELPHPEVLQWLQRGKVFLHPSSYEGFGIVCIEALYAGCQVISFVKPMNKDIQNWNIVTDKEEMIKRTILILKSTAGNTPVIPYTIEQTVEKISDLFSL